jgi:hypothetical protein
MEKHEIDQKTYEEFEQAALVYSDMLKADITLLLKVRTE